MKAVVLASLVTLSVMIVLLPGCDDDSPIAPPDTSGEGLVPDFALRDVNATSSTFDEDVSPRHYLGRISAWYFGTAT
jgi:hypothetical protein